jgi:hypothetical protein
LKLRSVLIGRLTLRKLALHVSFVVFVLIHVDFGLDCGSAIVVLLILWWIHDVGWMMITQQTDFLLLPADLHSQGGLVGAIARVKVNVAWLSSEWRVHVECCSHMSTYLG